MYPPPEGGADQRVVGEIAAAFQEAVADVIATKAIEAVRRYDARGLVLGGGVSANSRLREACREAPTPVLIPPPRLCTDNGAMIGAAGYHRYTMGVRHGLELDASPSLALT